MSAPSSCRGILISGLTNTARTQMAEAFLRSFTQNRIFIQSGGVHFSSGIIHPLALEVMADIGLPLTGHTVHSLESARRQRGTFDVLVSIDQPYGNMPASSPSSSGYSPPSMGQRGADRYQQLASVSKAYSSFDQQLFQGEGNSNGRAAPGGHHGKGPLPFVNMLFPSTPSHWTLGLDASDARLRTQLWSPADPQIAHEGSTRRFQDHIYEGEPLFTMVELNTMRKDMRLTERWYVSEVCCPFAAEREASYRQRFVEARNDIEDRCRKLVKKLEDFYDDRFAVRGCGDEGSAQEQVA